MTNNKPEFSKIIQIIDKILENIVWVNKNSKLVSLKSMLHQSNGDGAAKSIEDLEMDDLIGAFTCLQIRHELFGENPHKLTKNELAGRIKDVIFNEAKVELDKQNNKSNIVSAA
jgi:hypothetical protein